MLVLDHIAIAAETLDAGVAAVEAALGVALQGGGQHLTMGTHNRLLALGDVYLEVIAIDPSLPGPGRPRWFDLDRFSGAPRLVNWICRCDDLQAALARAPEGTGQVMNLARGDLRWQMAVPDSGVLPFDNAFPALISWQGAAHPVQRLEPRGVELMRLVVSHPDAVGLQTELTGWLQDDRVVFETGPAGLRADLRTPRGMVRL